MQKSKSFKKPVKLQKQSSGNSSKVLLQLSSITINSKDKSQLLQNHTQRECNYYDFQDQNQYNQSIKAKSTSKIQPKKYNYIKKNVSLSNTILKEIMDFSNSVLSKNNQHNSSKMSENDSDLIILSKEDLKKSKAFCQTKKSKKLMLNQKQTNQKTLLKSSSLYAKSLKGQPVVCSINIHPSDQLNYIKEAKCNKSNLSNSNISNTEKRRSSFSSRRSSIRLFQQQESQNQITQIKNTFLTKASLNQELNKCRKSSIQEKIPNFLKRHSQCFYLKQNQNDNQIDEDNLKMKQTKQSLEQISHRQAKLAQQQSLFKLDQLNSIQATIQKDAPQFITHWNSLMMFQKNNKKYQRYFPETKQKYQSLESESKRLKYILFQQNKNYLLIKKMTNINSNSKKQNILLEVQKLHSQIKKKIFKKDLEEIMIFNMKVVLPSSQMIDSSVSCLQNQLQPFTERTGLSILQIYQQLIKQKSCKKYGMILKKQINNMNIYDSRTMNEYIKRLCQLQNCFNKIQEEDPQFQIDYINRIEKIVEKIENVDIELEETEKNYNSLNLNIKLNQKMNQTAKKQLRDLINKISENIFVEYKIFQTGGQQLISKGINQNTFQNQKTLQQFKSLVDKKYSAIYEKYKQVKEQKNILTTTLKSYQ